jgi:hypothetical protein
MSNNAQDQDRASERREWTTPEFRHLAASEAELAPVIMTDSEGTS